MSSREGQIYSLFVETKGVTFLSVQYATSLEEAFAQAKLEFVKTIEKTGAGKRATSLAGAKIGLFTIKTVADMMKEADDFNEAKDAMERQSEQLEKDVILIEESLKKIIHTRNEPDREEKVHNKNRLMKEIIETKDKGLYILNRSQFTKQEQAYIRAQLKK